jgi:hypothetical protein
MKQWAERKSASSGKTWTVYLTGAEVSEGQGVAEADGNDVEVTSDDQTETYLYKGWQFIETANDYYSGEAWLVDPDGNKEWFGYQTDDDRGIRKYYNKQDQLAFSLSARDEGQSTEKWLKAQASNWMDTWHAQPNAPVVHEQGVAEGAENRHHFIRHNIWTVMDSNEEVMQIPVQGDPFFSAKKLIRDLDDKGYDFTHVISPEGKVTYLPQHDPRHLQGMAEGKPKEKEADYGADYQDMVARVKKLAGMGPLKTVYDPNKRVYRNVPTAVQPPKK